MNLRQVRKTLQVNEEDYYMNILNRKLNLKTNEDYIDVIVTLRCKKDYVIREKSETEELATITYIIGEILPDWIDRKQFQIIDIHSKTRYNKRMWIQVRFMELLFLLIDFFQVGL